MWLIVFFNKITVNTVILCIVVQTFDLCAWLLKQVVHGYPIRDYDGNRNRLRFSLYCKSAAFEAESVLIRNRGMILIQN